MSPFRINDYLREQREVVDQALHDHFDRGSVTGKTAPVIEAMQYSLFSGGKRLRPILTLATAEVFSTDVKPVLPLACAIEMIHTYSLIHDDLPALDNDTLRRGRATCHITFGVETAIQAGIGLLQEAMHVCVSARERSPEYAKGLATGARHLFHLAGLDGMVGGQVADIMAENKEVDLDEVNYIHGNKTAAMIEASVLAGCILFTSEPISINKFRSFGRKIGIAFQIIDDVLDILSESSVLGKNARSDLERGKATYPSLVGVDQSKQEAKRLIEQAIDHISNFDKRVRPLVEIARFVYNRKM